MAGLRYHDVAQRDREFMDLTSLTQDEFGDLVPVFEAVFQERMQSYGHRRTGRSDGTYENSPLPTPEDRLLFILVYVKTTPLPTVHGVLFGMPQNKTNQWIQTLLPVLQTALQRNGDAPARRWEEWTEQVQGREATPLFVTMALSDAFPAPRTRMNRKTIIAARKRATP
jgi:hypothetical protein